VTADTEPPIRVFVVDNHAVVRRGLVAFLEGEPDLELVGDAEGGAQALEALARLESAGRLPHVVLMDLKMPEPDGIASTRAIRDEFVGVEVVVLTSFGDESRVRGALEAGAAGYLLKDADADEVAAAIRSAHRGELHLDPVVARSLVPRPGAAPREGALETMTSRELDVLRLVGVGKTNKEIASALEISERTARTHVSNILGKLGLHSRTRAALWAVQQGLVDADQREGD